MAVDVDGLAMQLVVMHAVLAKALKAPELAVDMDGARTLAKGIKGMMAQYSVNISPKMLAFYQLMGACAVVYGPRLFLIADRKSKERAAIDEARKRGAQVTVQNGFPNPLDDGTPPPAQGVFKYQ
jgi:hypothetical protein